MSDESGVLSEVREHLAKRESLVEALRAERGAVMNRLAEIDSTLHMLGAWASPKKMRNGNAWSQEGRRRGVMGPLVLEYLRANPGAIATEVREATGCARNFLNWLEGKGRARSVGARNSTQRWFVADDPQGPSQRQGDGT